MNRRTFLESSVAAAVSTSLPTRAFPATRTIEKVGVQLYTVRNSMKTDFAGTIAKVAAIGYKEFEFAGYFNHSPKEIRLILEKNTVSAPSCHVDYKIVQDHWPETLDAAHTIGQQYIVCPSIDDTQRKQPDGYKRAAELFNKAGEASKKAGIQFAYHNHTAEFQPDPNLGGKLPYDFLLDSTDLSFLQMEMDLCWATVAGQDPVAYFNRYPGRFPLVHVKDVSKLPRVTPDQVGSINLKLIEADMVPAGKGVIDWKRIFASAEKAGIQHYFYENDAPKEPFTDLVVSYAYLSTLKS
jgi:sugar phosphate isomerase/epimerase